MQDISKDHLTQINRQLNHFKTVNSELQTQISILKEVVHQRDVIIAQLHHKLQIQEQTNAKYLKQIYNKQVLLKQNSRALYSKNAKIQELQTKLTEGYFQKEQEYSQKIKTLSSIIDSQEKQLSTLFSDEAEMVNAFEEVYQKRENQYEELDLLRKYNEELNNQIEDVQNTNERLLDERVQYQEQMQLQNQNGNDMLVQIQEMLQAFQHIAARND